MIGPKQKAQYDSDRSLVPLTCIQSEACFFPSPVKFGVAECRSPLALRTAPYSKELPTVLLYWAKSGPSVKY